MDIEKYRLHYLILEQQNLSQTARTTNYTQSTLSARVQKMEQELEIGRASCRERV